MNVAIIQQSAEPAAPDPLALRDALRDAIKRRDEAQSARDKIAASVARADEMRGKIEEELAALNDLDGKIASARATALKDALAKGAEPSILAMPKELKSLSAKRDDALNREAAVTQACEALQVELHEAETALAEAEQAARDAALPIMGEEAECMARELLDLEARAAGLRRRVGAYRSLRKTLLSADFPSTPNDWLPMSNATRIALTKTPANAAAVDGDLASSNAWREAFKALLQDSEAPLEGLRV